MTNLKLKELDLFSPDCRAPRKYSRLYLFALFSITFTIFISPEGYLYLSGGFLYRAECYRCHLTHDQCFRRCPAMFCGNLSNKSLLYTNILSLVIVRHMYSRTADLAIAYYRRSQNQITCGLELELVWSLNASLLSATALQCQKSFGSFYII